MKMTKVQRLAYENAGRLIERLNQLLLDAQKQGISGAELAELNLNTVAILTGNALGSTCFHTDNGPLKLLAGVVSLIAAEADDAYATAIERGFQPGDPLNAVTH